MRRTITKSCDLLEGIKEIKWQRGKVITNNTSGYHWSIPVNELFIGDDWYLEKYEIIHNIDMNSIIIDVGFKTGDWIGKINHILSDKIIRIGIDPIDYNIRSNINFYYNCAIDNVDEPTQMIFHLFDEPGCNSLLSKSEHLTMRNILHTITVPIRTLESVLLEIIDQNIYIHFLKCDCQGKDIDVVKSLRSFLSKTKYVQIECSFNSDKPFYIDQLSYEDDICEMDKIGFEPILWMEYLESPLPEGEIIFKNKNILE